MSQTDKPWVGVVTPVFNGEPYLAECIESVLSQTYTHFDYTIVNNCSTDRSLEIAERYAKSDSRIRVVTNETFLDQPSNFNCALSLVPSRAKYCKLALADDRILPRCLEEMVQVAESDPEVAMVGAYETIGLDIFCQGLPFGTNVISGKDACRLYLLKGKYLFGTPNCLLYRSSEVRRRTPFFRVDDGDVYAEDADACLDLLRDRKFGFVHQILTFTRRDNVSIISTIIPYRPWLLSELVMLHRYGKEYLTQAEFDQRWNAKLKDYLFFLGEKVLGRWDKGFWQYHKKGMEKFGYTLRNGVLAWNVALAFLDTALNPKSSIEKRLWRGKAAG